MTTYFLASSALVRRYTPEQGSTWMRSLAAPGAGHTIVVAQITQAEAVSAISRRKREGTIGQRSARAMRLLLDRHMQREYVVVALVASVIRHAEDLLEQHPLRAYDAIQLASALESNVRLTAAGLGPLIFVSADTRLLAVASAEGMAVDDPNRHP